LRCAESYTQKDVTLICLFSLKFYRYINVIVRNVRPVFHCHTVSKIKYRGRGDIWHTSHVIIFHIFFVLVKLNVRAHIAINTLGLQSDLHKFDAIYKE
jgi:hypothetical protein